MNNFEEKVMDEFMEVKQRMTSLETKIDALPCAPHTADIAALKISKAYLAGLCAGISLVVSTVVAAIGYVIKG